jgi:hypothetical protein
MSSGRSSDIGTASVVGFVGVVGVDVGRLIGLLLGVGDCDAADLTLDTVLPPMLTRGRYLTSVAPCNPESSFLASKRLAEPICGLLELVVIPSRKIVRWPFFIRASRS